jgi:hypothetical protein
MEGRKIVLVGLGFELKASHLQIKYSTIHLNTCTL